MYVLSYPYQHIDIGMSNPFASSSDQLKWLVLASGSALVAGFAARNVIKAVWRAFADDAAFGNVAGVIERHHLESAAYDRRQFRFGPVAVGANVTVAQRDDDEALNQIRLRGVQVVMSATARTGRGFGGELIEQRGGDQFHGM